MSKYLQYFQTGGLHQVVALDHELDAWVDGWSALPSLMIRSVHPAFTRDEWAYLISFLQRGNLEQVVAQVLGRRVAPATPQLMLRPRGAISVWLPSNVTLLGPLTLVLASIVGSNITIKTSSSKKSLVSAFTDWVREHSASSFLSQFINECLCIESFDRTDDRNLTMSKEAAVRIAFGSDESICAIESLPHRLGCVDFFFANKQSEAWVEVECVSDSLLTDIVKVLGVYGQAGCTSPRRVMLLGGDHQQAFQLASNLAEHWANVIKAKPEPHIASQNILSQQVAQARGWSARVSKGHGAVFCSGALEAENVTGPYLLTIIPCNPQDAISHLPPNIQTIGHAVRDPSSESWLQAVASTEIERFVPLSQMHHFTPTWDGYPFVRGLFEDITF